VAEAAAVVTGPAGGSKRAARGRPGRLPASGCLLALTWACAPAPAAPEFPVQISHSGSGAYEAALAVVDGDLAVAWYDTRDGNADIYVRWVDAAGSPVGLEQRLTEDPAPSYEASIDGLGSDLAVAWYEKARSGALTARLGVWLRRGAWRWSQALPQGSRNPVIRTAGDRVFCAWIAREAAGDVVHAAWWTAGGVRIGPTLPLGPASHTTWNVNAALDESGAAWVVYDAESGTRASELWLVRVAGDGIGAEPDVRRVRLTEDDGIASKYPDVAVREGRAALTWFDARDGNTEVYLATMSVEGVQAEGLSGEAGRRARRVTETDAESIGAYLTWRGDRIGLAWSDSGEGQHEVYFQAFDAGGEPAAPARRITSTGAGSLVPAIRPHRDGFALAWNEYERPAQDRHDEGAGRSEIAFAIVQ
jgi:hypothetical protein